MALLFPTKLNTVLSVFMVLRLPKDLESPKQVEWPTKDFIALGHSTRMTLYIHQRLQSLAASIAAYPLIIRRPPNTRPLPDSANPTSQTPKGVLEATLQILHLILQEYDIPGAILHQQQRW